MNRFTFTFFTHADIIYGYRFNITREEAQEIAKTISREEGTAVYYVEGYFEK